MFQTLRRIYLRIRIIISGIRAALYGIVTVAITWIVALPPSQAEIAQLDLPANATVEAEGVRHTRMAKLLVLVATDRAYALMAQQSGTGVSAQDFQQAVQTAANGTTPTQTQNGAKFVSARAN